MAFSRFSEWTSADPWLDGARGAGVRHRAQLCVPCEVSCCLESLGCLCVWVAVRAYISHAAVLDLNAREWLRGSESIVQEAVLQHSEGHVVNWAQRHPRDPLVVDCSRALCGLIRRLEYTRQVNPGIKQPDNLVSCVRCVTECAGLCAYLGMDESRVSDA